MHAGRSRQYGALNHYTQDDFNNYDSMQLTLNRRMRNGWTFNANYTGSMSATACRSGLIPYNLPQDPDLVVHVIVTASSRRLVGVRAAGRGEPGAECAYSAAGR